jgi:hypothetical protein
MSKGCVVGTMMLGIICLPSGNGDRDWDEMRVAWLTAVVTLLLLRISCGVGDRNSTS